MVDGQGRLYRPRGSGSGLQMTYLGFHGGETNGPFREAPEDLYQGVDLGHIANGR